MEKPINEANFEDTGYSYTLSLISGKYKPIILYCLMEYEPVRFNEMQRYLGRVADKTLSMHLKELERDGLIQNVSRSAAEGGVYAHRARPFPDESAGPAVHLGQ